MARLEEVTSLSSEAIEQTLQAALGESCLRHLLVASRPLPAHINADERSRLIEVHDRLTYAAELGVVFAGHALAQHSRRAGYVSPQPQFEWRRPAEQAYQAMGRRLEAADGKAPVTISAIHFLESRRLMPDNREYERRLYYDMMMRLRRDDGRPHRDPQSIGFAEEAAVKRILLDVAQPLVGAEELHGVPGNGQDKLGLLRETPSPVVPVTVPSLAPAA